MVSYRKLPKGSTYKSRGIIKKDPELGSYVIGNRLKFIIPHGITDKLYSMVMRHSESGGLLFFILSKSTLRTLVAEDIVEINNVSFNPWSEYLPDREQVTGYLMERGQKRNLFLPAFFHVHPVKDEYANIQYDFYRQAGPSEADMASSFWPYPYLRDGKLSLPEFIVCKHPTEDWMFIGFYDSARCRAIEAQKTFLQQEWCLSAIKEGVPHLRKAKKKFKELSFSEKVVYAAAGVVVYKVFEPQIKSAMNQLGNLVSAEFNLKIVETQMAAFDHVPFYTIVRYGQGCFITLPAKSYHKKITEMALKPRVTIKALKELKTLMR
jgi:hypothetical protein